MIGSGGVLSRLHTALTRRVSAPAQEEMPVVATSQVQVATADDLEAIARLRAAGVLKSPIQPQVEKPKKKHKKKKR